MSKAKDRSPERCNDTESSLHESFDHALVKSSGYTYATELELITHLQN